MKRSVETTKTEPAKRNPRRFLRWGLYAVLAVYGLLVTFPEPAFPYHLTRGSVTLYAPVPLPAETAGILDRANRLITACPIQEPGLQHRVFLCNGFARYLFYSPLHSQAVSTNSYLRDNIFLVDADLQTDHVQRDSAWQNTCNGPGNAARMVSGTIAHEVTHSFSRHHRGVLRSLLSPNPAWKEEGYCDWVAHDSSFDPLVGRKRIAAGETNGSPCYQYFTYREAVTYFMEQQGYDYDTLMSTSLEPSQAWSVQQDKPSESKEP